MKIVRDSRLLERIGCSRPGWYAMRDESSSDTCDPDELESGVSGCLSGAVSDIDNSRCQGDFEACGEGEEHVLSGTVLAYDGTGSVPRLAGVYDATGRFRMESGVPASLYSGDVARPMGVFIPQCKMMNSTVLDGVAEHPVYAVSCPGLHGRGVVELGESGMNHRDRSLSDSWARSQEGMEVLGTHVPFDLWAAVGVVFGKAHHVWRRIAGMRTDRMPEWMVVTVREVFETLNPGCEWSDQSGDARIRWTEGLVECFSRLDSTGLLYDLPDGERRRWAECMTSILENSRIDRLTSDSALVSRFGDRYVPWGFKVRLRGGRLFDFCWRGRAGNPSVVQIRPYDYDCKSIFGRRGWRRCFGTLWGAWLVLYRNHWLKVNRAFATCRLEWSLSEMASGFRGGVFGPGGMTTRDMLRVLEWYSVSKVFGCASERGSVRRNGHLRNCWSDRRGLACWDLPESLDGQTVLVKDEHGVNTSLEAAGVTEYSEQVRLAMSRMALINEENGRHDVTLDGARVKVLEKVIYHVVRDGDRVRVEDNLNGRCYSSAGGIQSLRRNDRLRVEIDGHAVTEVDYSSLHVAMLYSICGESFAGGDMYDVGDWHGGTLSKEDERAAVKMLMTRMINTTKARAIHSFRAAWNERVGEDPKAYVPWLMRLYHAVMRTHGAIAGEFNKSRGRYLMNLDGRMIREVCWRLARRGVCALAIHDSVLVDSRYAELARGIMLEEYARLMDGGSVGVKMKTAK